VKNDKTMRYNLRDLDVSEWIILKSILEKLCVCELDSLGSD